MIFIKQVGVSTDFTAVEAKKNGIDVDEERRILCLSVKTPLKAVAEIINNETPIVNALQMRDSW